MRKYPRKNVLGKMGVADWELEVNKQKLGRLATFHSALLDFSSLNLIIDLRIQCLQLASEGLPFWEFSWK